MEERKQSSEKSSAYNVLIGVSLLALSAAPFTFSTAYAQTVNIACPQTLGVGQHIACSSGSLRINPDGSTNLLSGCLNTLSAPQEGQCRVNVTGGAPTRDVRVSFNTSTITASNVGATFTIDSLRMQETGQPTTAIKLTFTPLEMTGTVTINFGGTLNFNSGQAAGNYTAGIIVNANFI